MEEDTPQDHPSGRLLILDFEVWVEDNNRFNKKPLAAMKVVFAMSSPPTTVMRSFLLEEGKHRLNNC